MKNISSDVFLLAKAYGTMTSGVARSTVFQKIRPETGFRAGDFTREKLGGMLLDDSASDLSQKLIYDKSKTAKLLMNNPMA